MKRKNALRRGVEDGPEVGASESNESQDGRVVQNAGKRKRVDSDEDGGGNRGEPITCIKNCTKPLVTRPDERGREREGIFVDIDKFQEGYYGTDGTFYFIRRKKLNLPRGPNGEIPCVDGGRIFLDERYLDVEYDSDGASSPPRKKQKSRTPAEMKSTPVEHQTPRPVLKQPTGDSTAKAKKNVTWSESPIDTPSKNRARAGHHTGYDFADYPSSSTPDFALSASQDDSPNSRADADTSTSVISDESTLSATDVISPSTAANTVANAVTDFPPGFIPTPGNPTPSTFCLDYDTYTHSETESEIDSDQSSNKSLTTVFSYDLDPEAMLEKEKRKRDAEDEEAQPRLSAIGDHELNRNRPATQKRPVGPSPLSQVQTMSSPVADQENIPPTSSETTPTPPTSEVKSDEFANLQWPKPQTYVEAGIASQPVADLYRKRVTEEDEEDNQVWFAREFERFKAKEKKAKENGRKLVIDFGDEEAELEGSSLEYTLLV